MHAALCDSGLAYQDLSSKRYHLSALMAQLGSSAKTQLISAVSQTSLESLAQQAGDTVFASLVEGSAATCVARVIGSFPIRTLILNAGDRRPLGAGAGSLAMLAAESS